MAEGESHDASGEAGIGHRDADAGGDSEKHQQQTQNVSSNTSESEDGEQAKSQDAKRPLWRRVYDFVYWTPPNLRWNPERPPKFSMGLNVLFGFAGAFTVANLYYSHPILNVLAKDFGVPYVKVSNIPTLAQAGYAAGLLFLCPLGDMLERRPFVLTLVLCTATMRYAYLMS